MAFESGETFSPSVRNPKSSATGLIGFMRDTAIGLGTTVEELAAMTAEEQLQFVHKYFLPYAGKIHSLADCYMAILWPTAVTWPEDAAIFKDASAAYEANSKLDINHDGEVTKNECASFVAAKLSKGLLPENAICVYYEEENPEPQPAQQPTGGVMPGILDAITGVAAASNPLAGLAIGLVKSLITGMAPLAQEKITKEMARHTDDATAASFANTVMGIVQQATGKSDPIEAVVAAKSDPAIMETVQAQTLVEIDKLAPLLDKVQTFQNAEWSATEDSMDRAAGRAAATAAGTFDMSKPLVLWALGAATIILIGLMAAMVLYAVKGIALPEMLLTLIVQTVTGILGFVALLFAFRYGSSRSSGAKDELVAQLAARRR